jgi:hypothetical protein
LACARSVGTGGSAAERQKEKRRADATLRQLLAEGGEYEPWPPLRERP